MIIGLLERYGQGGSGHEDGDHPYWSSFLVADADDGWVLETSGRTWATEQVEPHAGDLEPHDDPEFDAAHRHPRQPVETLVDPGWRASTKTPRRRAGGRRRVAAHLRSPHRRRGLHACACTRPIEATTASVIVELPQSRRDRSPAWRLGSPCSSLFVPLFVGRDIGTPIAWERFAALVPSHRRALGEPRGRSWRDMAGDDDGWADDAWRRVDASPRPPSAYP